MAILHHKTDLKLDALLLGLDGKLKTLLGLAADTALALLTGKLKVFRYPLYIQDFDKVAGGNITTTAKLVGWRFLVDQGARHFAIDFHLDDKGNFQFHSYNTEGHFETLRAKIDALPLDGDYRVADLRIPGLNLLSFWLQPDKPGKPDLVSPIDPAPSQFVAGQVYVATDFQQVVQQVAATQGCSTILPPPSMAPAIDTNLTYLLTNRELGATVALDGIAAMQRPAMKAANGSDFQKWKFVALGGGYYRLICVGIGMGSALEGGAKNLGAVMNGTANQTGQMWRPVNAGSSFVNFVNMFTENDNYAFNGGALNGGALISLSGHSSQNWKLTVVP